MTLDCSRWRGIIQRPSKELAQGQVPGEVTTERLHSSFHCSQQSLVHHQSISSRLFPTSHWALQPSNLVWVVKGRNEDERKEQGGTLCIPYCWSVSLKVYSLPQEIWPLTQKMISLFILFNIWVMPSWSVVRSNMIRLSLFFTLTIMAGGKDLLMWVRLDTLPPFVSIFLCFIKGNCGMARPFLISIKGSTPLKNKYY